MIWLALALMFILISSMVAMCIDIWECCEQESRLAELWDDDEEFQLDDEDDLQLGEVVA